MSERRDSSSRTRMPVRRDRRLRSWSRRSSEADCASDVSGAEAKRPTEIVGTSLSRVPVTPVGRHW